MANRVQIGSIWMDGILKRPCFRFEPEDHFPFDPVANIEFRGSTGGPDDIIWIVANNKLIADRPVMHSASFADLQELNLVHGQEVVLDGQRYWIRTLMDLEEWTSALDEIGEDDHIWHWEQRQSFLQQPSGEESKVLCTDLGNPYHAVTAVRTDRRYQTGWRPVLELARKPDFRQLEIGQKLLCWGGQSLVSGILLEDGAYDLVLQRQDGTDICHKDATTFASPAMGDKVIVNKSAVAGVKRKEK